MRSMLYWIVNVAKVDIQEGRNTILTNAATIHERNAKDAQTQKGIIIDRIR